MSWTDDTGPVPNRTEDEFLALVRQKADAAAGRRRWQAGLATAALLFFGLLATVVLRSGPDAGTELRTVSGGLEASTTSTSPPATTGDAIVTTPDSTTTTTGGAPTTASIRVAPPRVAPLATTPTTSPAPAAPATTVSPTTRTSLACRNSWDPACGPRYWDPAPGPNQPMTVAVSVSPAAPKAGDTVTFRVTVDDPDGSHLLSRTDGTVDYGDGTPTTGVGGHVDCAGGSGPWTPPSPVPVHEELTYQHVYAAAGTYTVTFTYHSMGNCAYGPSDGIRTTTVTVTPRG